MATHDVKIGRLVSPALLAALREVFPLTRPSLSDSERKIFLQSGHQEVIEFLQAQYDATLEQALAPE